MARQPVPRGAIGSLILIAGIVAGSVAAFSYTGGFLSPGRLTPEKLLAGLAPSGGAIPGHRRNHAKGICFTGTFRASGAAASLSQARVFAAGDYPVIGRFNLGTPDPQAADGTVRVRGLGLQITTPDRRQWRSAMIDAPVFPVATPQAFYGLLQAAGSKDPDAMKSFIAGHPEFPAFAGWAGSAPYPASYAGTAFNSLNSFLLTDAAGRQQAVRWSFRPEAPPEPMSAADFAGLGPNHLAEEITKRVAQGPQRWTLVLTLAEPGDPTADPSRPWPEDRRRVEAGTLTVERIQPEPDGPCRDINFDPTILPAGISLSDDPFPAARSAAYARSFNLRTSEWKDYPREAGATGAPRP
ncbi:catalase family peroxidase [Ancylobacter sp. 6x-1]|uniref:Catalase-related peroxidase n=1 Tax=Ancylobacter crimeensis TaxID=2579147 RepID=A0ABT0D7C4_9HYPH|nr:catalase family peroxidase [Ancylobacter crimeensis]MCK0195832.1 catalase family peroxidase [Ancylobacter crimeensis]